MAVVVAGGTANSRIGDDVTVGTGRAIANPLEIGPHVRGEVTIVVGGASIENAHYDT